MNRGELRRVDLHDGMKLDLDQGRKEMEKRRMRSRIQEGIEILLITLAALGITGTGAAVVDALQKRKEEVVRMDEEELKKMEDILIDTSNKLSAELSEQGPHSDQDAGALLN
ncbi:hypothetical protein H6758_04810 [Candidatus Nomurabacteria bacterium]|nr:hypothetical protein [Candidatus Nomurabacteria bacterium]